MLGVYVTIFLHLFKNLITFGVLFIQFSGISSQNVSPVCIDRLYLYVNLQSLISMLLSCQCIVWKCYCRLDSSFDTVPLVLLYVKL